MPVLGRIRRYSRGKSTLMRYTVGDVVSGESFTGNNVRTYFDINGILQTANTNVKRDAHFIGGVKTLLVEPARTNVVLFNRDLTNAAWVKTNCAAVKDQTGIDGALNSASRLTASGANATCLQAIVLASSARLQSAYIKRLSGVGNIDMTTDGGTTWTTVATTGAYTRLAIPVQTLTNPSVGFRIVTSGDAIAVDYIQNENTAGPISSPILTGAAAVLRTADLYSLPFPSIPNPLTVYTKFVDYGNTQGGGVPYSFLIGSSAATTPYFRGSIGTGTRWRATHHNGVAAVASPNSIIAIPVTLDTVELRSVIFSDGSVLLGQSLNGGAEVSPALSAANTFAAAWAAPTVFWVGSDGANAGSVLGIISMKVLMNVHSMNEARAA